MVKKRPFLIFLGIAAVVAVLSLIAALGLLYYRLDIADAAPYEGISRPAPDFSLVSLDGENIRLSDLRGTPVLLNFWATWCDPCLSEMPLLEEASQRYGDKLLVLGINQGDRLSDIEKFIAEEELSYVILLDTDEAVGEAYDLHGYPTSVFIDARGVIRAIYLGEIFPEQLEKNLHLIGVE